MIAGYWNISEAPFGVLTFEAASALFSHYLRTGARICEAI